MQPQIVIFDLDKTLLRKNSSFSFYVYLLKQRLVPVTSLYHALLLFLRFSRGELSLANLHREVFQRILKGLYLRDLEEAAHRFLSLSLNRLLREDIFQLCQEAKQRGSVVCLLSSSPTFLVQKVAHLLSFDLAAGTQYAIDKEGRLCDIASLITGPEKREFAKQWVEARGAFAENAIAYADSCDDLPLLEWVGVAIAVSPDKALRQVAEFKNWKIIP